MSQIGVLKYSYLAHLSQPAADRIIYRAIKRARPTRILEIGLGDAVRAQRMVTLASRAQPDAQICYVGLDQFEGGGGGHAGIALKQVYRLLRQQGARVQLLPADSYAVLAGIANIVQRVDLMVLAWEAEASGLDRVWAFLPRMLAPTASVFLAVRGSCDSALSFRPLTPADVSQRAAFLRRAA